MSECHFASMLLVGMQMEEAELAMAQMFEGADSDFDDRISRQEVAAALAKKRREGGHEIDWLEGVSREFDAVDADGDGHLDDTEVGALMDRALTKLF